MGVLTRRGGPAAQAAVRAYAPGVTAGGGTVVLVEGLSDHAALRVLAEALDLSRVPGPLGRLLAFV